MTTTTQSSPMTTTAQATALKRIFVLLTIVVLATGITFTAAGNNMQLAGLPLLAWIALFAFAVQWLAFIPAYLKQTEHFFDLIGSLTFISTALLALVLGGHQEPVAYMMTAMVLAWAIRLGSFLFLRIRQDGSDSRFDEIKPEPLRFLIVWTLQGMWVFLTLLPLLIVLTSEQNLSLSMFSIMGALIWLGGFIIEVAADQQKRRFRAARERGEAGRFITSGLWAWSRHPNYFGEIMLWSGLFLVTVPYLSGGQWIALLSPVFVALLLIKISGIPKLEAQADKRYGDDPEYQDYKSNTPVLLLRRPRRG